MRRSLIFALFCLSTVGAVQAQTYQWKDSQGRTIISDTPPPSSNKSARTITSTPGAGAGENKSYAEKDMDFRKRQQDSREKAEKDAKEAANKAQQAENCDSARRQLAALESGVRLGVYEPNGERRFMEDAERQREIEKARSAMASACK